jgi:hypothetical protein
MQSVFLCHAPADAAMARELAGFLERGADVEVYLEDGAMGPGETIVAKAREGLMADVLLLLFSPASVPPRWNRAEWEPAFCEEPKARGIPVAGVRHGPCKFPKLDQTFDLAIPLRGMREIKRWLIGLAERVRIDRMPPRRAVLAGRDAELEDLRRAVADSPGNAVLFSAEPGAGKTALAMEFAHRCGEEFEDVLWFWCGGRSKAGLAGDLAAAFGWPEPGGLEETLRFLREKLSPRRYLLVFDGVDDPALLDLLPGGRCSSLMVTERADAAGAVMGSRFEVSLAGGDFEVRLRAALSGLTGDQRRLAEIAAVCAPAGLHLAIAAAGAGLAEDRAREMLAGLVECGLAELREEEFYALHESARRAMDPPCAGARLRFAEAVAGHLNHPADLAGAWQAFQWTAARPDAEAWDLAGRIAICGAELLRRLGRAAECFEWWRELDRAAQARDDSRLRNRALRGQRSLLREWGKEREADQLSAAITDDMPTVQLPLPLGSAG